jgi:transposase
MNAAADLVERSVCETQVALAALKGDRTLGSACGAVRRPPQSDHIVEGTHLEQGAADMFAPGGGKGAAQLAVDVKSLHAKIGELTLENDFLEGALGKASLLSANR